jgi:peroxiredoxin
MRTIVLILVLLTAGCSSERPPSVYKNGDKVRLKGYEQVMVVGSDNGYHVNVIWLDKNNQPHNIWYRHDLLERQE